MAVTTAASGGSKQGRTDHQTSSRLLRSVDDRWRDQVGQLLLSGDQVVVGHDEELTRRPRLEIRAKFSRPGVDAQGVESLDADVPVNDLFFGPSEAGDPAPGDQRGPDTPSRRIAS